MRFTTLDFSQEGLALGNLISLGAAFSHLKVGAPLTRISTNIHLQFKTENFSEFLVKRGGVSANPIQKILIRKNWDGQSLNGGGLGRAGDGEQRLAPTL